MADDIPATFLILASWGTEACQSRIVDDSVALVSDFDAGHQRLMSMLAAVHRDGMQDDPELTAALSEINAFLNEHRARYIVLEPIEIWITARQLADRVRNPSPIPDAFRRHWRNVTRNGSS